MFWKNYCFLYLDSFNIPPKYKYFCICQFPAVLYQDHSNHDIYFHMSYASTLGQWSSNHFVSHTSCLSLNKAGSPFCGLRKKRKNDGVSPVMYRWRCEEQVWIVMASITSLNRPVWLWAEGVIWFERHFPRFFNKICHLQPCVFPSIHQPIFVCARVNRRYSSGQRTCHPIPCMRDY